MPILDVRNLTKKFTSGLWPLRKHSEYIAVNNVSFAIDKGEILGLLGPNGAGKTTTIQMLLGTLTPTSGTIAYFGQSFARHRIASLERIGYASGYDKLPARLTVTENLDIAARIYNIPTPLRTQQIATLLHAFQLWNLRDQQTGTLSAGQSTRLILAKAFINNPDLVLLDEPTASLDPDVASHVRQFILTQRKERGTSILITSHNMQEVTELCDRVLVLKRGCVFANNTPAKLTASIHKAHLHLDISSGLDAAISYVQEMNLVYTASAHRLSVELDEQAIAPFLIALHTHNVAYSHISIDTPTLQDYFMSIAGDLS